MNQKYELKPLTSSSDNAYVEAMKVYLRVMPADVKTDTNEIAYSLEHPVAANGRKMFFFALRYQSATIGFAQFAFLPNQKVLFMDYLAISEDYKKNSIFYPFFSMIMIYFNDIGLNYDYFITEIGAQNHDEAVDNDSAFLRKVLAMEDFKIIDAKYKQPCLGIQKQESNIDAHLYLKTSAPLYMITQEYFLNKVFTVYKWNVMFILKHKMRLGLLACLANILQNAVQYAKTVYQKTGNRCNQPSTILFARVTEYPIN